MKTTSIAASLSALFAAVSAQGGYSLLSVRSASPIHLRPINAYQEGFWIGEETQSYCPSQEVSDCPAGNTTAVSLYGDRLSMDVEVPGGQLVYVQPDGAVKYTIAHSGYIPEGSIVGGWSTSESYDINYLSYEAGIVFCASSADNLQTGPYQMFAGNTTTPSDQCLGAELIAQTFEGIGAWEYE